ncbi:hypothetical protein BC829DRAFT_400832 [Chytridium lagenaria]|nr:hypothetical protein BC829DRAFT_400832 [Chytridium lagenaria]
MGQLPSRPRAQFEPLLQSKGLMDDTDHEAFDGHGRHQYFEGDSDDAKDERAPIISLEGNSDLDTIGYSTGNSHFVAAESSNSQRTQKLEVAPANPSPNSSDTALKIAEELEPHAGSKQSLSPTIRGILQNGTEIKKDRRVSIMVEEELPTSEVKASSADLLPLATSNSTTTQSLNRRRSRLIAPDPYSDDGSKHSWKTPSRSNTGTRSTLRSASITRRASIWSTTTTSNKSRERPISAAKKSPRSIQFSMDSASELHGSQGQLSQSTSSMPDEDAFTIGGSNSQLVGSRSRQSRKSSIATYGSSSIIDTLTIPHASSGDISAIQEEDDTIVDPASPQKLCKCGEPMHRDLTCEEAVNAANGPPESPSIAVTDLPAGEHQQNIKWKSRKKREKEQQHQQQYDGRYRRGSNSSNYSDASGGKVELSAAAPRDSTHERTSQRSTDHLASRDSIAAVRTRARAPSMKTAASSFVGSQFLTLDLDRQSTRRQAHSRKESIWSERTKKLMISNRKMSMELEEMKYASLVASLPRVASIWEFEPA